MYVFMDSSTLTHDSPQSAFLFSQNHTAHARPPNTLQSTRIAIVVIDAIEVQNYIKKIK